MLNRIAKHFKSGKGLDSETREKIIKRHLKGLAASLYYVFVDSLVDQDYHSGKKLTGLPEHSKKVYKRFGLLEASPGSLKPAGWGHMGSGYGGSYYAYMYSLVMAYDFFARFEKDGPFNKKTGKALRKVLEKGGSMDEMIYIKEFLGRKPNNKAFLKVLGIK